MTANRLVFDAIWMRWLALNRLNCLFHLDRRPGSIREAGGCRNARLVSTSQSVWPLQTRRLESVGV